MKKILTSMLVAGVLLACNANPGESGAVNDGIKAVDENGALSDSDGFEPKASIDSSIGDHRVDTERRDTSTYKY